MVAAVTTAELQRSGAPRGRLRGLWYTLALSTVISLATAGLLINETAVWGVGAYVVALFAVCASPLLLFRSLRGPGFLLLAFLAFYFATFAMRDLSELLLDLPMAPRSVSSGITEAEWVIIAGAILFTAGYLVFGRAGNAPRLSFLAREWSPVAAVVIGILCWLVGAYYNGLIQFGVGDANAGRDTAGLGALGGFFALFRVLGPVGTCVLIYSYLSRRSVTVLIILLVTMAGDFALGFLEDSKETAFRAPLLLLFGYAVLRERIPTIALVATVLIGGLTFDYFAAYREFLGTRGISRGDAIARLLEDFGGVVGSRDATSERFVEGIDYASSRVTLKTNVTLIVERTGEDIEYQRGYTLWPIFFAFIPRFILPDKQDASATGLIFNEEFGIAPEGTYISVSQIGEFYWNFGWAGVIVGMLAIGCIMGLVGALCRLDREPGIAKFLLLMLTIYLLVLRFESGTAMVYTYWARAVLLFLLLHAIVPKARARS